MLLRVWISPSEVSEQNCSRPLIAVNPLRRWRWQSVISTVIFVIGGLCSPAAMESCRGQDNTVATDTSAVVQDGSANTNGDDSQNSDKQNADSPKTDATEAVDRASVTEINLLEKGLSETWNYLSSDEKSKLSDVWVVKSVDGQKVLICRGTPKGFLYTKTQHSNFRLTFEWKYIKDPNSNSGVLIYTQKEPRLWPTAMQVQLHQPMAGCIFPGGDATSDNSTQPQGLARKIGEWNSCLIVSEGGKLSVEINGRKAGEVSGCQPSTGFIALQAEGSETHFRKLKLQVLPPPEAKPAVTVKVPVEPSESSKPPEAVQPAADEAPKAKPATFDG